MRHCAQCGGDSDIIIMDGYECSIMNLINFTASAGQ